jgi:exopolysaccharide production protein ExoY
VNGQPTLSFISTEHQGRHLRSAKLAAKPAILPVPGGPSYSRLAFVDDSSVEIGAEGLAYCPLGGWTKRTLDITLALTLLVLLAPLILIVALLISVTSAGDVFFSQRRIGLKGGSFSCFKFRTMVPNAEAVLRSYLENNPEAAREWGERQKLQYDPRITWLGQLLRRSSIDELPQLINVLRGEMSLIGPRPIVASELDRYGEFHRDYLSTRPGLTGMWQVSGRSRRPYQDRVALDRYYVRRWSIWLDLWIIINTIPAVLRFDDAS